MTWANLIAAGTIAYALGCLNAGYYITRLSTGADIRAMGTGTAGAMNVGRSLGRTAFAATLLLDLLKGSVAVWVASRLAGDWGSAVAMIAVVAGHIWPAQLRLRGGKGIAAGLGALAAFDFPIALAAVAVFAGLLAIVRRWLLAGMSALVLCPVIAAFTGRAALQVCGLCLLAGVLLFSHRRNLREAFRTEHAGEPHPGP
jgi:glycerol-3-phosphate acyltransferase PlsY